MGSELESILSLSVRVRFVKPMDSYALTAEAEEQLQLVSNSSGVRFKREPYRAQRYPSFMSWSRGFSDLIQRVVAVTPAPDRVWALPGLHGYQVLMHALQ